VWCEQRGLPHVLVTRSNDAVATVDWRQRRVRALIAEVPAEAWARRSAGAESPVLRRVAVLEKRVEVDLGPR
jgi:hypothetical protein